MHKTFYASGFLYYLPFDQILLQQNNSLTSFWSLFGKIGHDDEAPIAVFREAIFQNLHIKLALDAIYPVYDYFKTERGMDCFVFYAEVGVKKKNLQCKKDSLLEWFSFYQTAKLSFSDQIRQDLIVSERVIKAKARDREATFSPVGILQ